jgi:hypothetical protein
VGIDTTTLGRVRYPPERFVDSTITNIGPSGGVIATTPLNLTSVFSRYGVIGRLNGISTDQTANTALLVTADSRTYPPNGANLIPQRPLSTPGGEAATFVESVTLTIQNNGAAATANTRADWGSWFWRPTIADKLELGMPITDAERAIWSKYAPPAYTPLITPDQLWEHEYARPQIMEWAGTANVGTGSGVPVGSQSTTIAQNLGVPEGFFEAVLLVWVDASIGGTVSLSTQAANGLTVNIDRDQDAKIDTWAAAGVAALPWGTALGGAQPQHATEPRIIGLHQWSVYLTTSVPLTGVPYRVLVGRYLLQDAQRARWNVGTVSQEVQDQTLAGVA